MNFGISECFGLNSEHLGPYAQHFRRFSAFGAPEGAQGGPVLRQNQADPDSLGKPAATNGKEGGCVRMAAMDGGNNKVIVAMSGGVDSSVAAALLKRQGYSVTGVFMCLGTAGGADAGSRGCCSPQDAADARRVADMLGIELYVLNLADDFEPIIEDFADQYARGCTPNPCVLCNSRLKFGKLIRHADSLGIAHVATGHYARLAQRDALPCIARAAASGKDQSYALFAVARQNLARMLLPLGEIQSKARVREIARELGLLVHDKPDSQEICFAPDDDYVQVLAARRPDALRPGDVIDTQGRVLGRHDGYARFTIGQRKGVRIAGAGPRYVVDIDPATATVTLGTRDELQRTHLWAGGANWHVPVAGSFRATVKIRYNHAGAAATVTVTSPDRFEVQFDEPVLAVTPGQAAVVYDGDVLLGGGWIAKNSSEFGACLSGRQVRSAE